MLQSLLKKQSIQNNILQTYFYLQIFLMLQIYLLLPPRNNHQMHTDTQDIHKNHTNIFVDADLLDKLLDQNKAIYNLFCIPTHHTHKHQYPHSVHKNRQDMLVQLDILVGYIPIQNIRKHLFQLCLVYIHLDSYVSDILE